MTASINGTTGVTFPDASTQNTAATGFGFKNRIINGAMMIDQRNAGASSSNPSGYFLDRWNFSVSQNSKISAQQNQGSVTPPVGFSSYLGITSSSAYSIGASDFFTFVQPIEGLNIADLSWGTANAATVTLSFKVYSSLTGTFGGTLRNSAADRSYPFTYTISSANTWTSVSVTIAGPTSGTWLTTNGVGIYLTFGLGVGSTYSGTAGSWATGANYLSATGATSVVGTNGATFYITGVQLEKGSTATNFDYRPYGTELALCQRYGLRVEQQQNSGDVCGSAASCNVKFQFPVTMRTTPTASFTTAGSWIVGNGYSANYTASSASIAASALTPQGGRVFISGFPGFGSNFFVSGTDAAGTAVMFMSAEL